MAPRIAEFRESFRGQTVFGGGGARENKTDIPARAGDDAKVLSCAPRAAELYEWPLPSSVCLAGRRERGGLCALIDSKKLRDGSSTLNFWGYYVEISEVVQILS